MSSKFFYWFDSFLFLGQFDYKMFKTRQRSFSYFTLKVHDQPFPYLQKIFHFFNIYLRNIPVMNINSSYDENGYAKGKWKQINILYSLVRENQGFRQWGSRRLGFGRGAQWESCRKIAGAAETCSSASGRDSGKQEVAPGSARACQDHSERVTDDANISNTGEPPATISFFLSLSLLLFRCFSLSVSLFLSARFCPNCVEEFEDTFFPRGFYAPLWPLRYQTRTRGSLEAIQRDIPPAGSRCVSSCNVKEA